MKIVVKIILLIISSIPAAQYSSWIIKSWFNSPLDQYNPIWAVAAIVLIFININRIYKSSEKIDFTALFLFTASFILFIGFNYLQINILALISALLFSLSAIWLLFGWKCFILFLPVYFSFILALPTTSYIISYFYSKLNFSISINPEIVKLILFIVVALFALCYPRQNRYKITRINGIYWFFVIICIILMFFYYSPDSLLSPPLNIDISPTPISGWYGEEYQLSNVEKKLYGDSNVRKLVFYNKNGYTITVLIFKTDGNPHKIHPPDYCLRGAGWSITSENFQNFKLDNTDFAVRSLTAELYNNKELILSWYSSKTISTGDFKVFRLNQRKSGENWHSYLISINILTDKKPALKELINFISKYTK